MTQPEIDLTPAVVWARSPMKPATINRVIAAAEIPVAIPEADMEALRLTLAHIAHLVFQLCEVRDVTNAEAKAIHEPFCQLVPALAALTLEKVAPPLPPLPLEWMKAMQDWLGQFDLDTKQKRRPNWHDRFAYPVLLAFFDLAFQQAPGNTRSGPVIRFLTAFFEALTPVEVTSGGAVTTGAREQLSIFLRELRPLSPENFRHRVRTFLEDSQQDVFVAAWFNEFRANLAALPKAEHTRH